MKNFISILSFFAISYSLIAQVPQYDLLCSTPDLDSANAVSLPYYANNQFLENYLVQKGYYDLPQVPSPFPPPAQRTNATVLQPKFFIPLNIYIYRDGANNTNSSINETQARDFVCRINEIFLNAGTAIQFYANLIEFNASDAYNHQISSLSDVYLLWASKRVAGGNSKGINVHFIKQNLGEEAPEGKATLPHYFVAPLTDYSLYVRTHSNESFSKRSDTEIAGTLAHEIGHTLGLLHTHHPGRLASLLFNEQNATIWNGCYQESVSRVKKNYWYNGCLGTDDMKKCEINGDFLCDTEADPNQSKRVTDCYYNHATSGAYRTDNWGDLWTPPTGNVMAYTPGICRKEFSTHQTAIMWKQIEDLYSFINYQEPTITSATSAVCIGASNTFTFNSGSLPNTSIAWVVEPPNIVSVSSGSGSSATLQASPSSTYGDATITFTIQNECSVPLKISKLFKVGKPVLSATYSNGGLVKFTNPGDPLNYNSVSNLIEKKVNMVSTGGQGSWQRIAASPTNTDWSASNNQLRFYFYQAGQTATFRYSANNVCGSTRQDYSFKSVSSGGGGGGCNQFSVSPNPSKNIVSIATPAPNIPAPCPGALSAMGEQTESNLSIQSIGVYDADGQLKRFKEFPRDTKNAELDISDLRKGIYIIKISDGAYVETQRIVKE